MGVRHTGRLVAPLVAVVVLVAAMPAVVQAQDICEDPANLTVNCQFDTFDQIAPYGDVASEWTPFVEFPVEQPPAFNSSPETPAWPAQEIFCGWLPFAAGIYQQVQASPGVAYVAAIGWATYASYGEGGDRNSGQFIGRKVGIDPLGGTDPTSASIAWSPEVWDEEDGIFPQLRVSAVAQRQTITVFVRAHNPQSHGNDKVFFDAVTLMVDPTQPTATATTVPPSATPTSPPPTFTSTALPPTATLSAQSTQTPVATHTSEPTSTATTAPEVSQTPEEAVAPNVAALPTAISPTAVVTPVPAPQRETYDWVPTILVAVAAASFLGAGVLGMVLLVLRHS
jgi:hypothetical protein